MSQQANVLTDDHVEAENQHIRITAKRNKVKYTVDDFPVGATIIGKYEKWSTGNACNFLCEIVDVFYSPNHFTSYDTHDIYMTVKVLAVDNWQYKYVIGHMLKMVVGNGNHWKEQLMWNQKLDEKNFKAETE